LEANDYALVISAQVSDVRKDIDTKIFKIVRNCTPSNVIELGTYLMLPRRSNRVRPFNLHRNPALEGGIPAIISTHNSDFQTRTIRDAETFYHCPLHTDRRDSFPISRLSTSVLTRSPDLRGLSSSRFSTRLTPAFQFACARQIFWSHTSGTYGISPPMYDRCAPWKHLDDDDYSTPQRRLGLQISSQVNRRE
jgi:hypothetical protein